MGKNVSKAKAEQVLRAVEKHFKGHYAEDAIPGDRPTLQEPGFNADGWSIAWEGHYDWPFEFTEAQWKAKQAGKEIKGVHLEVGAGWRLDLYPPY